MTGLNSGDGLARSIRGAAETGFPGFVVDVSNVKVPSLPRRQSCKTSEEFALGRRMP